MTYRQSFETKDLILAKAKMSDLKDIYQNFWSQPETAKYMLWQPSTSLAEAETRLLKTIEFQKDKLAYFVYEKKSGQAIGIAGMKEIAPQIYEDVASGLVKLLSVKVMANKLLRNQKTANLAHKTH